MRPMNDFIGGCRLFFIRLFNWEYWNSTLLYLPVLPYLGFLWFKTRSFFFFNAANPGIENGGFLMESKWLIDQSAPRGFFPDTVRVNPSEKFDIVLLLVMDRFGFPVVAKPDVGGKGRGVAIIADRKMLQQYHSLCPVPYLLQERISYPLEAGIFYARLPGESQGIITGIVEKVFVVVTGDGISPVRELLQANPRYALQLAALGNILTCEVLEEILPPGKTITLVDIGNHARGSRFINASHRINPELTSLIDKYCHQMQGFYYGRLDIRFQSWELLEQGKDFSIIELNGSGSEPTHIYDPRNSIFYVWKEICRHWRLMARISKLNHLQGVPYMSLSAAMIMFGRHFGHIKKLKSFSLPTCPPHLPLKEQPLTTALQKKITSSSAI